ncbi:DNA internalization-related competence protein ComEC/Rec2 [Acinetobacter sp. MB5]|uniref:DNA internalization-related competence protein ComEC/Rec2 n=1 Tax=Acinetobacter sp. MB5 TaxID=2069438 RepID=UPI001D0D91E2|nr:DNA internalization-related competence protein ComEC/Rec2 [Acinetobacter sp. MB5]
MKWNLIFSAWIIGICSLGISQFQPLLTHVSVYITISITLSLILYAGQYYFLQSRLFKISHSIALALAVALCAMQFAQHQLQTRLKLRQTAVETKEVIVFIKQMSQLKNDNRQQVIQVWDTSHRQAVNWLARLSNKQPELEIGHYYRLSGQVRPVHGYAIEGAFDQEKWFLQQNLMATLQVKHVESLSPSEALMASSSNFIHRQHGLITSFQLKIELQRLVIREWLMHAPLQHRGLLLALLTGDEGLLNEQTQQQFQNLGIQHLLAISGPHVLVFASLLCLLIHRVIARFCPNLYLKWPKQYVLSIPFLVGILLYCGFVGFEIPALRTLFMSFLIVLSLWTQQRFSALRLLLASAALLLLIDPFSVLSVSFWLSYGACFILLRIYQTIQQHPQQVLINHWQSCRWYLGLLIESQWKIFLALLPLVMLFFQQLSWLAPLANLIAIPLIGAVIVPLNIIATCIWLLIPNFALVFYHLADFTITLLLSGLGILENAIPLELQVLHFTLLQIISVGFAVLLLFLPRGIVPKAWVALCCLPVIFPVYQSQPFEFNVLDVGQGQAIHIRDGKKQILIDTGGSSDEQKFSLADRVLLPYFSRQGISKLDQVILSHLDQDHSGAFPRLAEKMPIQQVLSNQRPQGHIPSFDYCHVGQSWQGQHIEMRVLSPREEDLVNVPEQQNELSCVVYIRYFTPSGSKVNFLVMGDAGTQAEQMIMQQYPDLAVDVLVLGHHGSRFSSSTEFLQQLKPKFAVTSAGFHNRYGHPSREVKQRLQALNVPLLNTAEQGSLYFTVSATGQLHFVTARQTRQWLHL